VTQQFNRAPTYQEPLVTKGSITKGWFTLWTGLLSGQATGPVSPVTLGTSPLSYKAAQGGTLVIQGGSVSLVSFTRDGLTNVNTGQTQGMFPLSQNDTLIITYTGTPILTFVPR
jgi:hypothetical protein